MIHRPNTRYGLALGFLLLLGFVLAGFSGSAVAQSKATMRFADDEGIKIRGEVMRPQLVVLLSRKQREYDVLDQDMNFVDEIPRAVWDAPFERR